MKEDDCSTTTSFSVIVTGSDESIVLVTILTSSFPDVGVALGTWLPWISVIGTKLPSSSSGIDGAVDSVPSADGAAVGSLTGGEVIIVAAIGIVSDDDDVDVVDVSVVVIVIDYDYDCIVKSSHITFNNSTNIINKKIKLK